MVGQNYQYNGYIVPKTNNRVPNMNNTPTYQEHSETNRTDSHAYRAHLPHLQRVALFAQMCILLSAHWHNSLHINVLCVVCSAYSHVFLTHGMCVVCREVRVCRV